MVRDYLNEGGTEEKDRNTKPKPSKQGSWSWVRAHQVWGAPGNYRARWEVGKAGAASSSGWLVRSGVRWGLSRAGERWVWFPAALLPAPGRALPSLPRSGAAVELLPVPVPRRRGLWGLGGSERLWGHLCLPCVTSRALVPCGVWVRGDISSVPLPSLSPACKRHLVIGV